MASFRPAVLDVRRAGDWLAARPEVDPDRIGLMGVSLGALIASLVAGVDPNFDRVSLLIGGGDLAAIAMNGSREVRSLRERIDELGLTVDDLRELWRPIDPLTFASRLDPDAILMINAEEDEIIPRESTLKLQEAVGVENIHWFPGGHYDIVFQVLKLVGQSAEHLRGGAGE